MKLVYVVFVIILTTPLVTLAQNRSRDSTKLLCKFWTIDKEAMKRQFSYHEKGIEMANALDMSIKIEKNGLMISYFGNEPHAREDWQFSQDKKSLIVRRRTVYRIKILNKKQFAFYNEDNPQFVYYFLSK